MRSNTFPQVAQIKRTVGASNSDRRVVVDHFFNELGRSRGGFTCQYAPSASKSQGKIPLKSENSICLEGNPGDDWTSLSVKFPTRAILALLSSLRHVVALLDLPLRRVASHLPRKSELHQAPRFSWLARADFFSVA